MSKRNSKLALIFDFDETLVDDSVTQLLQKHNIDPAEFWDKNHPSLIQQGWDPTEAYLMLLVKEMKGRGKLDELTPHRLRDFGAELQLFEGVCDMISQLRELVSPNAAIQFFVISSGLQDVIAGTTVANELNDYWGCTLDDGGTLGLPYPKNVISFTEKTKYIFQINKGFIGPKYKNKPYEVNEFVEERARAIPLEKMIYVGDGLTDVACFSILEKGRGVPILVYNQDMKKRAGIQRAVVKIARHRSVRGPFRADYQSGSSLRNLIEALCAGMSEAM